MKTIILSIAICFVCMISYGQNKFCDIDIKMNDTLFVVPFGDTDYVSVTLTNWGPDTITQNDTIKYQLEGYQFDFILYDSVISPGTTVSLSIWENWAEPGTIETDTFAQCLYMLPSHNYLDTVISNDTTCFTEIFLGDTSALEIKNISHKGQVILYPNPAKGNDLYLRTIENNSTAKVLFRNVLGQKIEVWAVSEDANLIHINIAALPTGLYRLIYFSGKDKDKLVSKLFIRR